MARLAILAAAVAAVATAGYAPMVELDSGSCIVAGDFINDSDYALTLGDCDKKSAVEVKFTKQGGFISTEDDLCVAALDNSKKIGAQVVLTPCDKKHKSSKWNLHKGNNWSNGYQLCLGFDDDEETLVQVDCEDALAFELDGCKVKPKPTVTVTVTSTPAPTITKTVTPTPAPTVAFYTCSALTRKWLCPSGLYVAPASANIQSTADGPSFVKNCCSPIPTRTCGQFSVQMGGPTNVCRSKHGNFQLTSNLNTQCSATDNANCFSRCCVPVPTTQTCRSFVNSGSKYDPACLPGTTPIDNLAGTVCAANGSNCRKICCKPLVPPAGNSTCADWVSAGNSCPDLTISMPLISCTPNMGVAGCDKMTCCSIPRN